ncbi:MAG: hypothetical protein AVDCRST_MAG03-3834, partial [uncultured Rubrobacteraceae bacterium]
CPARETTTRSAAMRLHPTWFGKFVPRSSGGLWVCFSALGRFWP